MASTQQASGGFVPAERISSRPIGVRLSEVEVPVANFTFTYYDARDLFFSRPHHYIYTYSFGFREPAPGPGPSSRPIEVPVPPLAQETVTTILTTAAAAKEDCSITMTPIVVSPDCAVTPCGHAFNSAALHTWLTDHYTCPLCRKFCSEVSVAKGPVTVPVEATVDATVTVRGDCGCDSDCER